MRNEIIVVPIPPGMLPALMHPIMVPRPTSLHVSRCDCGYLASGRSRQAVDLALAYHCGTHLQSSVQLSETERRL